MGIPRQSPRTVLDKYLGRQDMILNEESFCFLKVGDRLRYIGDVDTARQIYWDNVEVTSLSCHIDRESFGFEPVTNVILEDTLDKWRLTIGPIDVWEWIYPPIDRENSWIDIWEGRV